MALREPAPDPAPGASDEPDEPSALAEDAAPPTDNEDALVEALASNVPGTEPADAADAAAEPAAPAEGEADKPPDEKSLPLGKAFRALERQKAKLKEREASLERGKTELEQRVRDASPKLALLERIEAVKGDPLALLELFGHSARSVTEQALRKGTPEGELAELKRQFETERQARVAAESRHRAAQEEQQFVAFAREQAAAYPDLAVMAERPDILLRDAYWAAEQIRAAGYVPDAARIAVELDEHYKQRHALIAKRHGQPPLPTAERVTAQAETPASPEAHRAPPKTISNRRAAESSGKTKPLTQDERRARALAILEGGDT